MFSHAVPSISISQLNIQFIRYFFGQVEFISSHKLSVSLDLNDFLSLEPISSSNLHNENQPRSW